MITSHNHRHHKKSRKYKVYITHSIYHIHPISNKFSKYSEIEYGRNDWRYKCLFPDTDETGNFFINKGIEICHNYFLASFKKSCSSLLDLFLIERTSTHFSESTENISLTLSFDFTVSSRVFSSVSFALYRSNLFGISVRAFLRSRTNISSFIVLRRDFTPHSYTISPSVRIATFLQSCSTSSR